MARRPSFSVAATVVTLLALLGFASQAVRPLIPTPVQNAIGQSPGDFLDQAATQRIDWRALEPGAFSDARRLDRPVLLVVGVAASFSGRHMDRNAFSAVEVQNYLARNFVCVRVDGDLAPQWLAGYLPISRTELGIRADHQMWVLEPSGRLVDALNSGWRYGRGAFLRDLIRVRQLYADLRRRGVASEIATRHAADVAAMRGTTASLPDFTTYGASLEASIGVSGGFPYGGYQAARPFAWRYLITTGRTESLKRSLGPFLASPVRDLIDGGFFRGSRRADFREVEFDKPTEMNADMIALLAITGNARDAMLDTAGQFDADLEAGRFLPSALVGDEDAAGRSVRSSFSPRRLREVLPDAKQREIARQTFGLYVETNPQMTPRLGPSPGEWKDLIVRLRAGAGPPRKRSGGTTMSANATASARIAEAGRLSGDAQMADQARRLFDRLDAMRSGNEVPHDLDEPGIAKEFLGDYLAFSDAALQDFLSTGRTSSLDAGLVVLLRALEVFQGATPGEFRTGPETRGGLLPSDAINAQIADDCGESATAGLIRLCSSYGRLLMGEEGLRLLRTAQAATAQYAGIAPSLGFMAAGYMGAAATISDDRFAVAVGPDPHSLALELSRLRPCRLVAPAVGAVRRDLQALRPGLYVIDRGVPSGPFDVTQAASRLPATLDVERGVGGP